MSVEEMAQAHLTTIQKEIDDLMKIEKERADKEERGP